MALPVYTGPTPYMDLIEEKYYNDAFDENNNERSYELYMLYLAIINAPFEYENEPEMMAYVKKHPDATMQDVWNHFKEITPDGPPPGEARMDPEDDEEEYGTEGAPLDGREEKGVAAAKQKRLRELLKKVPDTYRDFEIGTAHYARKFGYEDKLIAYMEKNPNASTSEITLYQIQIEDELGIIDDDL